jgi:hypothetical protein
MNIQDYYKTVAQQDFISDKVTFEQAYRETFTYSYGASMPVAEAKRALEDWIAKNNDAHCFDVIKQDGRTKASEHAGYKEQALH